MRKTLLIAASFVAVLSSCQKHQKENTVVSQRFVHKYGYAVSKEEWDAHHYPGQVITHLRDGVTVTQTYEAGILHGPSTSTFADSEIIATYSLYDRGNLVKEIHYDTTGMPKEERTVLSPTRYQLTTWYAGGSPKSIEEYSQTELLEGQYFSKANEIESKVEKGNGLKVVRNAEGLLLSKEQLSCGYLTQKEVYYPNGALQELAHYSMGKLYGEKKNFAMTGEPVSVEEYVNDQLHGKSTYFRNGNKQYELSYLNGQRNGMETHYIDGDQISYQVLWENGKKHGPETYYTNGQTKIAYYYAGEPVSHAKFDELSKLDAMIANISSDVKTAN